MPDAGVGSAGEGIRSVTGTLSPSPLNTEVRCMKTLHIDTSAFTLKVKYKLFNKVKEEVVLDDPDDWQL